MRRRPTSRRGARISGHTRERAGGPRIPVDRTRRPNPSRRVARTGERVTASEPGPDCPLGSDHDGLLELRAPRRSSRRDVHADQRHPSTTGTSARPTASNTGQRTHSIPRRSSLTSCCRRCTSRSSWRLRPGHWPLTSSRSNGGTNAPHSWPRRTSIAVRCRRLNRRGAAPR